MSGGMPMDGPAMLYGHWPMLGVLVLLLVLVALALSWFFSRPVDVSRLGEVPGPPAPGAAPDAPSGHGAERDSFVVIPDISGYTRYMRLNRFAAGHAQFVISRLLGAVLEGGQPPLTASRVEGDSVVFHAASERGDPRSGVRPGAVSEAVVRIVERFDRERATLVANNICPCGACQAIQALELKVVVNRGDVLRYRIGGLEDLSGLVVIETHRLLKNALGRERYVLVTEAASEVRLPWPVVEGGHVERYDDVGDVRAEVYLPPESPEEAEQGAGMAGRARDFAGKLATNARSVAPPAT